MVVVIYAMFHPLYLTGAQPSGLQDVSLGLCIRAAIFYGKLIISCLITPIALIVTAQITVM